MEIKNNKNKTCKGIKYMCGFTYVQKETLNKLN